MHPVCCIIIIIRGIERRAIFKDDFDRENFIERLSTLVPETQTICYAWVLMSNHAHFLLRRGPGGRASGVGVRVSKRSFQVSVFGFQHCSS
jgi:REP element-mobilizing transposase RayT